MRILILLTFLMISYDNEAQLDLQYQSPHQDIMVLADASPAPAIRLNTAGTSAVLMYRSSFKSIQELSETELRLAGLRINPVTNISSRARYMFDMKILDVKSSTTKNVEGLPEDARMTNFSWSPKQDFMAFTNTTSSGVGLWILDMQTAIAKKLTDPVLNANMGDAINWLKNEEAILFTKLPSNRKALVDSKTSVPAGPTISINDDGKKAQNRTYQDLLKSPIDEANFMTLAHSEIWKVTLDGIQSKWMDAQMYADISLSPDGKYVMVESVKEPFSYLVPYYRFPSTIAIHGIDGKLVYNFLEVPLIEDLPKGFMSVRKGPRSIKWRDDKPASLYWAEALDGGDPAKEVTYRDAVYHQAVPFTDKKVKLLETKERYSGIEWGTDQLAICYDYWWNTRNIRTTIFDPSDSKKETILYNERNYQDNYSDPGSFVSHKNAYGRYVLTHLNDELFLLGDGYSDAGKHPFVDKYNYKTKETTRIYQNDQDDKLESLVMAMDMAEGIVLTRIESKNEYPNYFFRNVNTGVLTRVTNNENPFEAIQDVHKEVIEYTRPDGVDLNATLYLPVGYDKKKKEKMPMLMWAYPREFKDKSSAGQVTSSPNEFTYPWYGSPLFWVNRGYVVLDDAAFPIVGEGKDEPNDSFREQLVANAKAAIDAVDAMGFIDRERVAVGGHSYGAFMTANLLSHSNLFAAGIARSGAYNRTLTPFGFQSEERNYWEAPDVYNSMSPFMHAEKMQTPLLLVHGEADNNSGTYPMQSERYFNALKGLGATVRLVMLPKESHAYVARESILHMLWEQDEWLEKYVKNKGKKMGKP